MSKHSFVKRLVMTMGLVAMMTLTACFEEQPIAQVPAEAKPLNYLSKDGVGPINAQTPFNLRVMGEVFPNLNVAEETILREGEKYPVITVREQAKPLLSINPDQSLSKVFSVVVYDNAIGNRLEHKIGTKFVDIYPYDNLRQCAVGMEEFEHKVLCLAPNAGNILYLFSGDWNGEASELPPLTVLADWKLDALVWKPPIQVAANSGGD